MAAAVEICLERFNTLASRRLGGLRKQRNDHLPFHSLPPELHSHVIHLHVLSEKRPNERLASLEEVSWHWRQVIKDDPRLWTNIHFPSATWRHALNRSKDAPLDITVNGPKPQFEAGFDVFLNRVNNETHRWRSARISTPDIHPFQSALESHFPLLCSLELSHNRETAEQIELKGGRRLNRLRIHHVDVSWDQAITTKLEELTITFLAVDGTSWGPKLRTLLESSPNLRRLRLDKITPESSTQAAILPTPLPSPLYLSKLCQINLSYVYPTVASFIVPLEASPRLHTVVLRFDGPDIHPTINKSVLSSLLGNGASSFLRSLLDNKVISQITISLYSTYGAPCLAFYDEGHKRISANIRLSDWKSELSSVAGIVNAYDVEVVLHLGTWFEGTDDADMSSLGSFSGKLKLYLMQVSFSRPVLRLLTHSPTTCPHLTLVSFGYLNRRTSSRSVSTAFLHLVRGLKRLRPEVAITCKDDAPLTFE